MKEIWKPVVGFEAYYRVSNHGRVESFGGRVGGRVRKLLKPSKPRDGYIYFRFNKGDGKQKILGAHRVVAMAFLKNPLNKSQVNHIDFDKSNNSVSNLEWVTPKENTDHSMRFGRHHIPQTMQVTGLTTTRFPIKGFVSGMCTTKEGKKEYMKQYRKLKRVLK